MVFNCSESLSGILSTSFYLLEETSNWPIVLSDRSSGQIIFDQEENSVKGTVDSDSFRDKSKPKQSGAGEIHEIALEYGFITRSEALEQLLDQYAHKPGVAVVHFYNGFKKIYGSNMEPLFLSFKVENGTTIDSKSGTEVLIAGIQRSRPVYYTP